MLYAANNSVPMVVEEPPFNSEVSAILIVTFAGLTPLEVVLTTQAALVLFF